MYGSTPGEEVYLAIMKNLLALILCTFVIVTVIVFASDIRSAIDTELASSGHPRRVDIQLNGCATVNHVLYCVNTKP